jgi:hypothetical protein
VMVSNGEPNRLDIIYLFINMYNSTDKLLTYYYYNALLTTLRYKKTSVFFTGP